MASPNKLPKPLPAEVKAALQQAVKRDGWSQSKVAAELGVSAAAVSYLLNDRYPGDVDTMAARIRGQFMAETITCPVMGTLGRRSCLDYQAAPIYTNPLRSALAARCGTCPNRKAAT